MKKTKTMHRITADRCRDLEAAYISMIQTAAMQRVKVAGLWRTLLDPWYAYSLGPAFIKATSECPVTFNPSEHSVYRHVVKALPFRSVQADAVLNGHVATPIMREHAVPIAVLRDHLLSGQIDLSKAEEIRTFLTSHFMIGIVTLSEDKRLRRFKGNMPEGWQVGSDLFARYRALDEPIEVIMTSV